MSKILPAKEVVILKDPGEQETKSGLRIAKTIGKDKPEVGEVVAIGAGDRPLEFEVGDKIVFKKYMEHNIEIGAESFNVIQFKDIMGKVVEN